MTKSKSQIGRGSKNKGKVGEREVATLFREHGFKARRGQQFTGGGDSPDVVHNVEGLHIEVKRTEKFDLEGAMQQARDDSTLDEIPVVFHRKSRKTWVVVLDADDFLHMIQGIGL